MLKLNFKKVKIGYLEVLAVGVVYRIYRELAVKPERAERLRN